MKSPGVVSSFRMPAEWEPHRACLLLCPHSAANVRLDLVQPQFLQVIRSIANAGQEDVVIFAHDEQQLAEYQKLTENDERIHCAVCTSNDAWARDTGPTFVVAQDNHDQDDSPNKFTLQAIDWEFNAYGGPDDGCYWPCEQDQQVAKTMTQVLMDHKFVHPQATAVRSIPLVLEGGSIHTDGQGTILTTAECLLNKNRNPNKSKDQIETEVLQATGCIKMIWLDFGLYGDEDTNGHVDNWACFVKPGHVVLSWTDDETNQPQNYARCRHSLEQLQAGTDAAGRSLTVHKLHLPDPMRYSQEEVESLAVPTPTPTNPSVVPPRQVGELLAGSYVNFYIANKAVIVPQYGDFLHDGLAVQTLQSLFPDRTVVGVSSREILLGGGNIHCITQQVPLVP